MAIVRRTVATILYESVDRTQAENSESTKKMQRLVKGLLLNDRWTCLDEKVRDIKNLLLR
jgi:midasin (ATPase involved in ribosome maturation)